MIQNNRSIEFISFVCALYGDVYDDRKEDSKPGGVSWVPGTLAEHKSLTQFQKELLCDHNIKLSRSKIQKILISGNCWSTERSRQIQKMYGEKIKENSKANLVVKEIADELGISVVTVNINLPYGKVVYDLKDKSSNAKRIDRWRSKQSNS